MNKDELITFIQKVTEEHNYHPSSYSKSICDFVSGKIIEENKWIGEKYGIYFISWLIHDKVRKQAIEFFYDDLNKGCELLADVLMNEYFLNGLSLPITSEQYDDSIFNTDVFTLEDIVYNTIYRIGKDRVNTFLNFFRPKDADMLEEMLNDWKHNSTGTLPAYNDFK
jgi:predicted hydrocarbon binding protein